jgi:hypothetical protein
MANNPVQHLAVIVTPGAVTGVPTDGLNADYPAGIDNWWQTDPMTDPSTNNLTQRNMLVIGGVEVPRVLRQGGSGRPQFRTIGNISCVARTYTVQAEQTFQFVVSTTDLPLNFVAIMVAAGIGWTANPTIWAMTSHLLDLTEMNALAAADSGWVANSATFTDAQDAPC